MLYFFRQDVLLYDVLWQVSFGSNNFPSNDRILVFMEIVKTKQNKKKKKTLLVERFNCHRDFKANFVKPFKFARVQGCEVNALPEQKLVK